MSLASNVLRRDVEVLRKLVDIQRKQEGPDNAAIQRIITAVRQFSGAFFDLVLLTLS